MATVERISAESRFLLRAVTWETYLSLREAPENDHIRMTYDRGDLEMMSPSRRHEQFARFIERMIYVWTEELNIAVASCGSMTCKREDLERGLEPDNCYYLRHEPLMRAKTELDLATDPPPDLVIEIDLTRSDLDKLDLYARLGVPELWRYDGESLRVCQLTEDGRYAPRPSSEALPAFPLEEVERLLRQVGTSSETTIAKSFRRWVQARIDARHGND